MRTRRTMLGSCVVALTMLATACPTPPGGGGGPTWSAHSVGAPESGGVTPNAQAVGTTAGWYVEVASNTGSQPDGLSFYPRTGVNGNDLGAPQTFPLTSLSLDLGELSDHIYVSEKQQIDDRLLQFYFESGGTWSLAGTMTLSIYQNVMALTDDTMAVLTVDPNDSDPGVIELFDLTVVGGEVTATLNTTLTAPAAWGSNYQVLFGRSSVALDGDILAIPATVYGDYAPYRVATYRRVGGTWQFDGDMAGTAANHTVHVAIDDLGGSQRLAIGSSAQTGPGAVDLYVSNGAGWNLEEQLSPPVGVIDDANGASFGYGVALDGNLLVTGLAREDLPAVPGFANRAIYHHSVFHLSAGVWSYETRLTAAIGPVDPTSVVVSTALPHLAGNHVAGSSLISTTACSSPCVSFRLESWRFDRTPLP